MSTPNGEREEILNQQLDEFWRKNYAEDLEYLEWYTDPWRYSS